MSEDQKRPGLLHLGRAAARRASERLIGGVMDALERAPVESGDRAMQPSGPEPPVVARLVVEIRSDGSRTVARGVLEDATTNQTAAVRAEGTTPAQLARSLAGTLLTLPLFAARMARGLKKSEDME